MLSRVDILTNIKAVRIMADTEKCPDKLTFAEGLIKGFLITLKMNDEKEAIREYDLIERMKPTAKEFIKEKQNGQ